MNDKQKTSNFLDAINKYAKSQKECMEKKVEEYRAQKEEQATEAALQDAYHLIQNEIARRKSEIVRETALKEQNAKRELFALRSSLVDEVFSDAEEKIKAFAASPEYTEKLLSFAKEADALFGGEKAVVYLASFDMDKADIIKKAFQNAEVREDKKISLGGLKAFCPSKGIIADETFDEKLEEQKKWFVENSGLKVV